MAHIFLAIFLIIFGLNMLLGLSLPLWILGVLALIAGLLLLLEQFRVRVVSRTAVVERVDTK
jgi:hypothetical protein